MSGVRRSERSSDVGEVQNVGWLCPACGAGMHPAKLLKGYDPTDYDPERPTCALHGPLGRFRHIATDRREPRRGR